MNWSHSLLRRFATGAPARSLLVVLTLSMAFVAGCSCTPDPNTATNTPKPGADPKKKKKKDDKDEKPKPNFEAPQPDRLDLHPADGSPIPSGVKRGHWATASRPLRANNFDFQGSLHSYLSTRSNATTPYEIDDTRHRLTLERPAVLPKGQWKHLEMMFFIPRNLPPPESAVSGQAEESFGTRYAWLWHRLEARGGGLEIPPWSQNVVVLDAWQYFFVVLAATPERYAYLKTLESIRLQAAAGLESQSTASVTYYTVVSPKIDQRIAIPSHPMAWTSTAYLLWDDADPNLLTPEQRESLLDWLHWGGQLVISGPDSLATLRSSFLADFLPASPGARFKLTTERLAEFNNTWSIPEPGRERRIVKVVPDKEPEGIELTPLADGELIPGTGSLVAERRIGRGRIVVTSFSLAQREIVNWGHLDGFFNGCLLRRPARKFYYDQNDHAPYYQWNGEGDASRKDARMVTSLRYFSRDFQGTVSPPKVTQPKRPKYQYSNGDPVPEDISDRDLQRGIQFGQIIPIETTIEEPPQPEPDLLASKTSLHGPAWQNGGWRADTQSGVGGWSDASAVAETSRQAIQEAAGIQVPPPSFVLRLLAIYLVVLVPVNWLFFRMIGRVEWAWLAAPVIAIAGAITVIRMAQLDIGFARSRTEVGFLEVQGNHPRGHLSRFMALYTSLSTSYELDFASNTSVALPLATRRRPNDRSRERIDSVALRREDEAQLRGFQVSSNSTGLVHCEEMFDLAGGFDFKLTAEKGTVTNGSRVSLDAAAVIWRDGEGNVQLAWLGALPSKGQQSATWTKFDSGDQLFAEWEKSTVTAATPAPSELSLRKLIDLAQDPRALARGEARLIGWTGEELPGVTFQPAASQNLYRTVVLVHLQRGQFSPPQVDVNTRMMVKRAEENP